MKLKHTNTAGFMAKMMAFLFIPLLWSCEKELTNTQNDITPYAYQKLDETGGTWRPILLQNGSEIAVPAPDSVSSAAYQAELRSLETIANPTEAQKATINYWGSNALVRWNEIARVLCAKYNLPPAEDSSGKYPFPNAANPSVYPYFPFANPPYVSRALAYWGTAQFDALISAWHYKYAYNRPAPYKTNANIKTVLPQNNLPSYPSEDAVIAAVSVEILGAMFPVEKEYLKAKAAEHTQSRLLAGANTQSDLDAGTALGKAVAAKFIARSKTDGMKNAVGNQAKWDSIAYSAKERSSDGIWLSVEWPRRPPMLPLFGKVKPWCFTDIRTTRPAAPPAIGSPEFGKSMQELEDIAKNLSNEQRRIANFWADGAGTYTPPGHWNRAASGYIVDAKENPLRTARSFAYLNMSLMDAAISCWETKYYYCYPRPVQVNRSFKSVLGTPNFPSYTSGHSTFSGAAAAVLGHLYPSKATDADAMAKQASDSRMYGGIHYRFDCEVGLQVGKTVGDASNAIARLDGAE